MEYIVLIKKNKNPQIAGFYWNIENYTVLYLSKWILFNQALAMTNVTEVLGDESGIQYQGVIDASGGNGSYPTIGLMVGYFRRGRIDKPMTITNENIRALLGYQPMNWDYVAVQDVLNTGVPSVQVLRITDLAEAPVQT